MPLTRAAAAPPEAISRMMVPGAEYLEETGEDNEDDGGGGGARYVEMTLCLGVYDVESGTTTDAVPSAEGVLPDKCRPREAVNAGEFVEIEQLSDIEMGDALTEPETPVLMERRKAKRRKLVSTNTPLIQDL